MSDVVDDGWGEAGVSTLRWLFAEALADYQVWENLPADITIEWYNAHRWDLRVTAPSGRQTLINVKRCWAHSATYLGFGGPIEPHQSVHYIALVQLEDLDALWSRDPGGRIRLTAAADPVDIYYLPNNILRAEARWDGNATGRALIPVRVARKHHKVPTFD